MLVKTDDRTVEAVRVQTFTRPRNQASAQPTMAARVMLLTDRPDGPTAQRLAAYGSLIDVEYGVLSALSAILDDPMGFDLFVMDCDAFGGVEAAEHAISKLIAAEARMRVMLISREFDIPAYPMGLRTAVCLPDNVSETGFRRGFDHVLRDRSSMTMM